MEDGKETDPFLVHVCPVQQEDGNTDCGVFAIVLALRATIGRRMQTKKDEGSSFRLSQKEVCAVSN